MLYFRRPSRRCTSKKMKSKVKSDFDMGGKKYVSGQVYDFTDEQVSRLTSKLEPVKNKSVESPKVDKMIKSAKKKKTGRKAK